MNKKDYQRPTMKVVEIQQAHLLTGSTEGTKLQDYKWNDYDEQ